MLAVCSWKSLRAAMEGLDIGRGEGEAGRWTGWEEK